MINIPMRTEGAWKKDTLSAVNTLKPGKILNAQNIEGLNRQREAPGRAAEPGGNPGAGSARVSGMQGEPAGRQVQSLGTPAAAPAQMKIPALVHPIQKGQKVLLSSGRPIRQADICLGWNSTDARCDVDVSAFLLGENGKVIGDDWFVFYGQTKSPDGSTVFEMDGVTDREVIRVDLSKLASSVQKIVFVLTINEAAEKGLHFGMLKDAYIRILDHRDQTELVSFSMTDYYTNVISMMIGELYQHNGNWKFHGVGNGVAKDLAGLCGLYGVQVSG